MITLSSVCLNLPRASSGILYSLLCNKYIGTNIKIHVICLNNTYLEVGSVPELKEKYQLTIEDLLKEIERNDHLC